MGNGPKLRVAVAGCGQIARTRHAPEYQQNPNVQIVGFYDVNPARAAEMAQQFGGKVYTDFPQLLGDTEVDAISVCTPNFLHAQHSIDAMRSGKDVLCEKPMALNMGEANEMLRVQRETGRLLMPGHNQRFVRAHIRARELLEAGEIGRVLMVQTNFKHAGPEFWSVEGGGTWFLSKEKAHFGVLGDLGAHKIDLVRYLLGDELDWIFARLSTLDKRTPQGELIDIEDNAVCLFTMKNGISGTMHVSWTNYGQEDNSTVVYGTKGALKIFASELDDIVVQLADGSTVKHSVGAISTNTNQIKSGIIDAFVAAAQGGDLPVTGEDGKRTLACLVAARASGETGTWTKVAWEK